MPSYLLDIKNTEDNNKFFVKTATLEGTEIILAEKTEGTFWGARFTSPTDLITLFKYSGFSEYMDMYLYVENSGFKISFGGNVFSWAFSGRTGSIFVRTEAGFMIKENLYLNAAVAGELNKEKVMFAEARAALSCRFTIPLVD